MPATRTFWKLSVGEKAFPSGNGWTLSWRTIPSRPTAHKKTHVANLRVKHLKAAFATRKLLDISPDDVESYLRKRMRQRALIKTALGYREGRSLKPATVHQELRVLRRILNVAVRKRLIPSNPCSGVESPSRFGAFSGHTTSHGRNSSASNATLPRTCAMSSASSPKPASAFTRS